MMHFESKFAVFDPRQFHKKLLPQNEEIRLFISKVMNRIFYSVKPNCRDAKSKIFALEIIFFGLFNIFDSRFGNISS